MKTITVEELQSILSAKQSGTVHIDSDYSLKSVPMTKMILGRQHCLHLLAISSPGMTIDGDGHQLDILIEDTVQADIALLEIPVHASGTVLKNWRISFWYNGENSTKTIYIVRNLAKYCKLVNCRISMQTNKQVNMTAVFNQGTIDTLQESGADELVIEGCSIHMCNEAQAFPLPQTFYGIYNNTANSLCLTNNYLYVRNNGNGEEQQAIGVFNSGRFARICNNNIKANGSHNMGLEREKCYTTGLLNEGDYMLLSGNNIVAEWGGQCLGVVNYGSHSKIEGNKILATHTVKGRSVRQYGARGIIANNILTSTSRNPRIVEIYADCNLVQGNIIDALLRNDCRSGCGVRLVGSKERRLYNVGVRDNNITGAVDVGVLLSECEQCVVTDNFIEGVFERKHFTPVLVHGKNNTVEKNMIDAWVSPCESIAEENLDESKIVSIYL